MIDLTPASPEARLITLATCAILSLACVVWFAAMLVEDYRKAQRDEEAE